VKRRQIITAILLACLFAVSTTNVHAQETQPIVRAVLFYSPTCGHCEYVINGTILPMMDKYGEKLEIIGLDISQEYGQKFFMAALQKFNLEQGGVPFLVIDDMYLVGSKDIPEKFPGLVDFYLLQGGLDWPDIPGLREAITQSSGTDVPAVTVTAVSADGSTGTAPASSATLQTTPEPATASPASASPTAAPALGLSPGNDLTWRERFALDPSGNGLSVAVLAGMLGAIAWAVDLFKRTKGLSMKDRWSWAIPALCIVGAGVAGYLAYVETTQVTAVCGPVGDCNTVQQSEYARLFGILPIGVLGLAGYVFILVAWGIAHRGHGRFADLAALSLFAMTAFGTLFSIYLTFLEPFVIGATCAWCLTSAILMTVLMLLSVRPAKLAFSKKPFAPPPPRRRTRIGAHDD